VDLPRSDIRFLARHYAQRARRDKAGTLSTLVADTGESLWMAISGPGEAKPGTCTTQARPGTTAPPVLFGNAKEFLPDGEGEGSAEALSPIRR
jgi:hypothetical protein